LLASRREPERERQREGEREGGARSIGFVSPYSIAAIYRSSARNARTGDEDAEDLNALAIRIRITINVTCYAVR